MAEAALESRAASLERKRVFHNHEEEFWPGLVFDCPLEMESALDLVLSVEALVPSVPEPEPIPAKSPL